jgi:hypothetical protein
MELGLALAILIGFALTAAVVLGLFFKILKFAFDNAVSIVIVLTLLMIIIALGVQ